jgi:Amt family ammonium transporter
LLYGNPSQLVTQIVAVAVVAAYAAVVTFVLLKVIDATMKIRVTEEEEQAGLDSSQHGEVAYGDVK